MKYRTKHGPSQKNTERDENSFYTDNSSQLGSVENQSKLDGHNTYRIDGWNSSGQICHRSSDEPRYNFGKVQDRLHTLRNSYLNYLEIERKNLETALKNNEEATKDLKQFIKELEQEVEELTKVDNK